MDNECPQCHSHGIDSDLVIEEDGGDYTGEVNEFWRYICYDCGHTWDQCYDVAFDPYAADFDDDSD